MTKENTNEIIAAIQNALKLDDGNGIITLRFADITDKPDGYSEYALTADDCDMQALGDGMITVVDKDEKKISLKMDDLIQIEWDVHSEVESVLRRAERAAAGVK